MSSVPSTFSQYPTRTDCQILTDGLHCSWTEPAGGGIDANIRTEIAGRLGRREINFCLPIYALVSRYFTILLNKSLTFPDVCVSGPVLSVFLAEAVESRSR